MIMTPPDPAIDPQAIRVIEIHGNILDADLNLLVALVDDKSLIGPEHFGGGSTRNDRLELAAFLKATADVINKFTQRDLSDFHFKVSRFFDVPTDTEDASAGVSRGAESGVCFASHLEDMFHMAEALDVVDDRRATCRAREQPESKVA